ncbi:hypothetical protein MQA28_25910 [Escherichia coli]|nr:hypothetical protein [Escherichia coli]
MQLTADATDGVAGIPVVTGVVITAGKARKGKSKERRRKKKEVTKRKAKDKREVAAVHFGHVVVTTMVHLDDTCPKMVYNLIITCKGRWVSHMNYRALLLTVEDVPFTAAITNHHVVIMKALDMVIPHTSEGVVLHEARLDADGEVPVAVEDIEERTTRTRQRTKTLVQRTPPDRMREKAVVMLQRLSLPLALQTNQTRAAA